MAKPLDQKEIVTIQELAISNMLEIAALWELLFEKGIISEEEFLVRNCLVHGFPPNKKGQSSK
jgi:hypothetical protein